VTSGACSYLTRIARNCERMRRFGLASDAHVKSTSINASSRKRYARMESSLTSEKRMIMRFLITPEERV
jgi:hypothetical protein